MKIIQLKAENVLRLRAVEVTPTGEIVKITGGNGQGKTSVLDAIYLALDQRRVGAAVPLHKGAQKGKISLNLGEVTVERKVDKSGLGELKITAADGSKITSPQRFLDQIIGELSFDPLAFDRMKPAEQLEQLRRTIKVDYDFDGAKKQDEADYNRRTELNRLAKEKRAQAEGLPLQSSNLPAEPINTKQLLDTITGAAEENAKREQKRIKRQAVQQEAEAAAGQHARNVERVTKLREEIAAIEAENLELADRENTARARLAAAAALPEIVDVSATREMLNKANDINAAIAKREERAKLDAEAERLETEAAALTDAIDARALAKETAIAESDLPVEGLSFNDTGVLFNDLPYQQASHAERIKLSMALAMAANPKLRVIRINDGALLDSKSMAIIGKMAKDNDFQVWCEIVDESGKIGVVIEDGAVASVNE